MRYLVTVQSAAAARVTLTVDARTMTGASNRALKRVETARPLEGWRVLAVDAKGVGMRA
jgi:hypothetical protein